MMQKINNLISLNMVTEVTEVYRKKVSGMVAHQGLKLTFYCGDSLVLHNNPEKNTHLSSLDDFAQGEVIVEKNSYIPTESMLCRLRSSLLDEGRYSVFNNCEHLVSKILTGKPSSAQLTSTILSAGLGGLLYSFTKGNKGFAVASLAIIAGGLLGLHLEKKSLLAE